MSSLVMQAYVGIPGSLTIEVATLLSLAQSKPAVLYPYLKQPIFDNKPDLMGSQWGQHWVTPMTTRLNALGGSSRFQLLSFEAPSVDTTDMGWFATGDMDATTDPITITAPITSASIYGRQFQVGDYVVWDDSGTANGLYQYEIDRIVSVNGDAFTLSRSQQGGAPGRSYFGGVRAAHTSISFYRLLDRYFQVLWDGSAQVFKFLWDGMIVSAIQATSQDVDTTLLNLFPIPPTASALGLVL